MINDPWLKISILAERGLAKAEAGKRHECIISGFGGLRGAASTAMLNPPLPERVRKVHVDKDGMRWSDIITLPDQPSIGTSREIEAISSLQPDQSGGDIDLPDVAPARSATFPCMARAGRLALAMAAPLKATANCRALRSNSAPPTMGASIPKKYLVA